MNFNFLLAVMVICVTVMFIVDAITEAYISAHKTGFDKFLEAIAEKVEKTKEQAEDEDDQN